MDPAKSRAKGSGNQVVAQLTLDNSSPRAQVTMGMVGKLANGDGWRENKVAFNLK